MANGQHEVVDDLYDLVLLFYKKLFSPNEAIRNLPIPQSHGKVLVYLSRSGPASITEIANGLAISKPNMTPILDKLLTMNLISRKEDLNDRRIMRVELTPIAQKLLAEHEQSIKESVTQRINHLSKEDLTVFHRAIREVQPIIEKIKDE